MPLRQRDIEAERDRILREAGFEDIERPDGSVVLPSAVSRHVHRPTESDDEDTAERFAASEEYYRRAGQFLWEKDWYNPVHRRCWELHSEGASYTRIVRTMKHEGHSIYRRKVHYLITAYRREMLREPRTSKRGRPVSPTSMRQSAVGRIDIALTPKAALGLDEAVKRWGVSRPMAIRRMLELAAEQLAADRVK